MAVSKTRGRGRGRGHLNAFFKFSFNPNSDLSQFASAVYRYNTFRYIENKETNKKRCAGAHFSYHPKQSRHISVKPIEYFFSNSTLISAIKSRSKSSQWKIKPKLTAELMNRSIPKPPILPSPPGKPRGI